MKITAIHVIITKIMKILEINLRITKIMKIFKLHTKNDNHSNYHSFDNMHKGASQTGDIK